MLSDTAGSGAPEAQVLGSANRYAPGGETKPMEGVVGAVVARDALAGRRIAGIACAASGFLPVVRLSNPGALGEFVGGHTKFVMCDVQDAKAVLGHLQELPTVRLAVWSNKPGVEWADEVLSTPNIASVLGWPDDAEYPRRWELTMTARRLVFRDGEAPSALDILGSGGYLREWRPGNSGEINAILDGLLESMSEVGVAARLADRLTSSAHEMLMNAIYDAPVDASGHPIYAHRRSSAVVLDDGQVPSVRLGCDGETLFVRVDDPFGRLTRESICASVNRGVAARRSEVGTREIVESSTGGAGIGIHRIISESAVTVFDVVPGRTTAVTSFHPLDKSSRVHRGLPRSMHFFGP